MITQAELKAMFVYEPETGLLRRIDGKGRSPYPWHKSSRNGAYLSGYLGAYRWIFLHRAVWLYHYGTLPERIDHKDNDPKNCRIENLRACTDSQNKYNSKRRSDNKTGVKGVIHCTRVRKPMFAARICVDGRVKHLGCFENLDDAAKAYATAAAQYAGEFARTA